MKFAPESFDPAEEPDFSVPSRPKEVDAGFSQRASAPVQVSDPPFRQLTGILYRRISLVVGVAVLGTCLAGAVGLLIPPKYTAKAQIVVEPQAGQVNGQTASAPLADEPAIDTQVTMLTSHDNLQRVVDSLAKNPQSLADALRKNSADLDATAADSSDRNAVSSATAAEKPSTPAGKRILPPTLDDLERYLRVSQERTSRVIGVSYTSTDPAMAAAIANRIVQLFVDGQSEQKREITIRELARLDDRIAELKKEVEQAGAAVQRTVQQRLAAAQNSPGEEREADIRLRELEREGSARDQLYTNLVRRQKELRYQQEIVGSDVRILSLASPPDRPSSPSPLLFIFPAFVLFPMGGCLLAVAAERLDRGLRSEQEVVEALGLPCLGLVSQLSRTGRIRPHKYLLRHPFSAYTEAIRSVVAGLRLTMPHEPSKIILTSSSVPSEGKTTLAVSLAVYIAQIRRRVLLVDLDFRHPTVQRALRTRAKRGVVDLLLHDLPPADVIQRVPHLGLDFLPMTRCPLDPVTLFAGDQLTRLLHQLRESYDCVIVDGPPLLGVTESRLLAGMADKVLFVVKWGSTRRETAQNAVNVLRSAGCLDQNRVQPSTVLTQVDLKEHARYRYGDVGEHFVKYEKYYSNSVGYWRPKLSLPKPAVSVTPESDLQKAKVPEA
ncbi:MAG: AAA family ATPase [Hyphomicrobiales bacterium]|nr:AAA family ATPase [Hyphomicrobiales bacterium]